TITSTEKTSQNKGERPAQCQPRLAQKGRFPVFVTSIQQIASVIRCAPNFEATCTRSNRGDFSHSIIASCDCKPGTSTPRTLDRMYQTITAMSGTMMIARTLATQTPIPPGTPQVG